MIQGMQEARKVEEGRDPGECKKQDFVEVFFYILLMF